MTSQVGAIAEEQARLWVWDREEGEVSFPQTAYFHFTFVFLFKV